jgi:hypothetical protein
MSAKNICLIILASLVSCRTIKISENSCKLYQKGIFEQNAYNNSGLGHWRKLTYLINRSDSTETVISLLTKIFPADTTYFRIKWIDECSYETTYLSGGGHWLDSLIRNKKIPDRWKCSIIKGTDKFYIQKRDRQIDTMWIKSKNN